MTDLNLLRTFVAVAECRSVTQAAKALSVPKSTVSRQIAKLEEHRDAALFIRGRTGLDLTPFGHRLFEQVRRPILELSESRIEHSERGLSGPVSIYAPSVYSRGVLQPVLIDFLTYHPDISLDLTLGDRFTSPDASDVDLVVHVGLSPGKAFEIWSLAPVEARLYASPTLFADAAPPRHAGDLHHLPFLTNNCSPGAHTKLNLFQKGESISTSTGPARLVASAPDLLASAAEKGLGLARLPTFVAEPFVSRGTLIPVLPDCVLDRHTVTLAKWHRNTNKSARVLAQFLVAKLGQ